MPTLKEIKGRIGSVRSTLKITSAMKLVSSAKLRKAQNAIAAMRPYQQRLEAMLRLVQGGITPLASLGRNDNEDGIGESPAVIVAVASNSSLCGGFNANIISKVRSVRRPGDVVYSIGRKMADAMVRDGFRSPEDYSDLAEHPAYAKAAELVQKLSEDFYAGRISGVTLCYTHFVSTSRQVPVVERLFPMDEIPGQAGNDVGRTAGVMPGPDRASDAILEPSAGELLEALIPKTLKLKLYAALLDSAAAEHAARTIAMQTATDNAENLLAELTLQYNKGRQQKITSEILDLAGGQAAE
ncbi:MAG: ATP synthase F1 subunit gamma [Bacteroidales bacterium]|nr:ATP synthase F1 subunit gamma [Bacteroidales bacterium]